MYEPFALFKNSKALKNANDYANNMLDKSKTTWAAGLAQVCLGVYGAEGPNPELWSSIIQL